MPGILMRIGGSNYLSATNPVTTIATKHYSNSSIQHPDKDLYTPRPVTIIRLRDSHTPTHQWINDQIAALQSNDDVINSEFLATILFHTLPGETLPSVAPNEASYVSITCDEELPSGPYLLLGRSIYQVFRLYPDSFGAFMYGTVPSEGNSGSYQRILSDLIPVPSRSYFLPPTEARPLSGKRIAVKDIYDISGLKTSAGSKAYNSLYDEATKTATSIQKLIDQGAVIVGKTKTTQFASGAGAIDWVDYQCPFNPRGCGYLDPECSSSGSGVAVAAYPWLDSSIGSDSLGSMVGPAASNGIFGLRPTYGLLSNEGAVPVSKLLDTPGHFSRNIFEFHTFAKAWLKGCCVSDWTLRSIMVPGNRFALLLPEQQKIIESFIKDLEKATKIQRTLFDHIGISDEYLSKTLAHIQLYDSYHNSQKFHIDFETKFGHKAYLDPMVDYKTKAGRKLSEGDYVLACNQKASLKDFVLEDVISEGNILLLPIDNDVEVYRDPTDISFNERAENFQGYGLKNTAFSPLLGIPCISFPVGQIRYRSKRSHSDEFRPVNLMILGPPGSDIHLIELIKDVLERCNRPLEVKVGKTAFET